RSTVYVPCPAIVTAVTGSPVTGSRSVRDDGSSGTAGSPGRSLPNGSTARGVLSGPVVASGSATGGTGGARGASGGGTAVAAASGRGWRSMRPSTTVSVPTSGTSTVVTSSPVAGSTRRSVVGSRPRSPSGSSLARGSTTWRTPWGPVVSSGRATGVTVGV